MNEFLFQAHQHPILELPMTIDEYIDAWEKGLDPWVGGGDQENKVE